MAENEIHDLEIHHADAARKIIKSVAVCFGDKCQVEVAQADGKVFVRMVGHGTSVLLAAGGPRSCFDRAVNILSLYLPESRVSGSG